jgi:hypothetical protein
MNNYYPEQSYCKQIEVKLNTAQVISLIESPRKVADTKGNQLIRIGEVAEWD